MNAPNRCALSSWPTGWRGWLLVAVLAVWWAGVSVGEWVRGELILRKRV